VLTTKEGFEMAGYFHDGKTRGPGCFTAPNGDRFYGTWNEAHKRDGNFLAIRDVDNPEGPKQSIEVYDDGQLVKRMKPAKRTHATVQWMPVAPLEYGAPEAADGASAPCARSAHATALLGAAGDVLALFGGVTCGDTGNIIELGDFWLLNVLSMTWAHGSRRGTPPPALHGHTLTVISPTQMVLIGGQDGMGVSSGVYLFDTETDEWSQPVSRSNGINLVSHTATLVDGLIYVIVGSSLFTLDTHSWVWREEKPVMSSARVPRSFVHHAAAAVGGLIYVHGGQVLGRNVAERGNEGKEYIRCSGDLRVLDTATLRWEVLDVPPPRHINNHAGKATGKGGVDKGTYSGVELGSALLPRSQHTLTLVDGRYLYLIGGWTASHPQMNVIDTNHLADVHVYDTAAGTWSSPLLKYPISAPRAEHTATLVRPDEIWVLGGTNDGSGERGLWDLCVLQTGVDARSIVAAPKSAAAAGTGATAAAAAADAGATPSPSAAVTAAAAAAAEPAAAAVASASAAAVAAAAGRSRWGGAGAGAGTGTGGAAPAVTPAKQVARDSIDDDDEPFEIGSGNILEAFKKNMQL
jgi:hypothetical protein